MYPPPQMPSKPGLPKDWRLVNDCPRSQEEKELKAALETHRDFIDWLFTDSGLVDDLNQQEVFNQFYEHCMREYDEELADSQDYFMYRN